MHPYDNDRHGQPRCQFRGRALHVHQGEHFCPRGTPGARSESHSPGAGAEQEQRTVFLVEDDEDVRFAMTCLLAREGYRVLTAATAHDALGVLRAPLSPIDVAVLDVQLPDASSVNLFPLLRQRFPSAPVIVCTGRATPEEAAALLRLGAHRYLRKPVSADELLAAVEACLP
jgi:DNA-binding NtrC family response regulator